MSKDKICGKCLYHRRDGEIWICTNPDSDLFCDYTEYEESCSEFEERQAKTRFSEEL